MRWLLLFLSFYPMAGYTKFTEFTVKVHKLGKSPITRPYHIRFGKIDYKVYYVHKIFVDGTAEWDGMTYCESTNPRVEIVNSLDHEEMAETLLHEALHVATECDGGATTTHQAIYRFAPIVNQLLRENPDLLKFIANK